MGPEEHSDSFNRRLERARQNDRDARDRILADERQRLHALALRRISPRLGQGDPSDLVQDCLTIADRRLDKFEGRGRRSFRAWLNGILNNVMRRTFRSRARETQRRQWLPEFGDVQLPDLGWANSVGSQVGQEEHVDLVRRAVDLLSTEDQALIRARYWVQPERTFEELAEETGITAETLRQRLCRLREVVEKGLVLLACMDRCQLPAHDRQVLIMRHFRKCTYEEIGDHIGTTANAARKLCQQAEALLQSS